MTPYGQALLAKRNSSDFRKCFGFEGSAPPIDSRALESLLLPAAGPSLADMAYRS